MREHAADSPKRCERLRALINSRKPLSLRAADALRSRHDREGSTTEDQPASQRARFIIGVGKRPLPHSTTGMRIQLGSIRRKNAVGGGCYSRTNRPRSRVGAVI